MLLRSLELRGLCDVILCNSAISCCEKARCAAASLELLTSMRQRRG